MPAARLSVREANTPSPLRARESSPTLFPVIERQVLAANFQPLADDEEAIEYRTTVTRVKDEALEKEWVAYEKAQDFYAVGTGVSLIASIVLGLETVALVGAKAAFLVSIFSGATILSAAAVVVFLGAMALNRIFRPKHIPLPTITQTTEKIS